MYSSGSMDDTNKIQEDEIQDDSVIEDAVIVETDEEKLPEEDLQDSAPGAVSRILDLERSIKTYYQSLLTKREELKKNRDMVNDALNNDKLYEEQQKQAEEFKRKQSQLKDQVMNIPSVISAREEIKNLGQEIKDMQKTLSKFLLEYRRLSNSNQIEIVQGELFEIVEEAKLAKSKSSSQ